MEAREVEVKQERINDLAELLKPLFEEVANETRNLDPQNFAEVLYSKGVRLPSQTVTEWGVKGGPAGYGDRIQSSCADEGGRYGPYTEQLARKDTRDRKQDLYKRENSVYVEEPSEWVQVQSAAK